MANNNFKDIAGMRFGKLIAVASTEERRWESVVWLCKCDCGKEIKTRSANLIGGHSRSCGCSRKGTNTGIMLNRTLGSHPSWKGYGMISGEYFGKLRYGAKIRNILFDISIEYLWKMFEDQGRKCALTGQNLAFPPQVVRRGMKKGYCSVEHTASLDRIDSNLGYIVGNIQWVHKEMNLAKHSLSQKRFIELCQMVVDYARK